MEKHEKVVLGAAGIVTAAVLGTEFWQMYLAGPLGNKTLQAESVQMAVTLFAFFVLMYMCLRQTGHRRFYMGLLAVAAGVFLWCHLIFLPVVVSGLYVAYLTGVGEMLRQLLNRDREHSRGDLMMDFVLGSMVWVLVVCLMSALGHGSIQELRRVIAVTVPPVAGFLGYQWRQLVGTGKDDRVHGKASWMVNPEYAIYLAVILTMLAMQAGRVNITMDYDSLHYGLRTPYILNNGSGIYENLGNINVVYTYSKGLEVLAMPLSGTATYGYVLSFNLWMLAGILWTVHRIVRFYGDNRSAWWASMTVSCIPGIMNMGITAKSDCITLMYQLFFLYTVIRGSRETQKNQRTMWYLLAVSVCLMTYTMKPTAMVFSSLIGLASLIWLVAEKKFSLAEGGRWWAAPVLAAAALGGIWARTWILTGYPVTSVFTQIFEKVGCRIHEPFAFSSIPDNGVELSVWENIRMWSDRLYGMFLAPKGEDMAHVVIAWGTGLILILLVFLGWRFIAGRGQGRPVYLYAAFLPYLAVCGICVKLLWQVDGNYFMLCYSMAVILAAVELYRISSEQLSTWLYRLAAPVILLAAVTVGVTNWSGVLGLTPEKMVHKGYYDHQKENYQYMADKGNEAIWNILAKNPKTRVLAMGEHLDTLRFPCNVQSYYDLTGSGGNVVMVKTLDNFKDFLRYAGTEYLYVQAEYLEETTRAYEIVGYMIEDGSLADIRYENGNVLARINLDQKLAVYPRQSLEEFQQLYHCSKTKL